MFYREGHVVAGQAEASQLALAIDVDEKVVSRDGDGCNLVTPAERAYEQELRSLLIPA